MSELWKQIAAANQAFLKQSESRGGLQPMDKYPSRRLAVLTCMDTRLVDFLEPAMGLHRGEAKIIKVAGNMAGEEFDSVVGSLMVAVYELRVRDIIVMGHDCCGMLNTTSDSLCRKMAEAGIGEDAIAAIRPKLAAWADPIGNIDESVQCTVHHLRSNPYLPKTVSIYGMAIHPDTGKIRIIDDGACQN